ncbi:MAG: AAA family ATPase [Candidatus Deferrimicrobium sp.]|nr:AAA family ATPase [Candidatus Deferrimicrobium sp.]
MKLYIASTSEFAGKTLLALALGTIWKEAGVKVGYVKPLGKIPVMREGQLVDGARHSWRTRWPWTRRRRRSAPS